MGSGMPQPSTFPATISNAAPDYSETSKVTLIVGYRLRIYSGYLLSVLSRITNRR